MALNADGRSVRFGRADFSLGSLAVPSSNTDASHPCVHDHHNLSLVDSMCYLSIYSITDRSPVNFTNRSHQHEYLYEAIVEMDSEEPSGESDVILERLLEMVPDNGLQIWTCRVIERVGEAGYDGRSGLSLHSNGKDGHDVRDQEQKRDGGGEA